MQIGNSLWGGINEETPPGVLKQLAGCNIAVYWVTAGISPCLSLHKETVQDPHVTPCVWAWLDVFDLYSVFSSRLRCSGDDTLKQGHFKRSEDAFQLWIVFVWCDFFFFFFACLLRARFWAGSGTSWMWSTPAHSLWRRYADIMSYCRPLVSGSATWP